MTRRLALWLALLGSVAPAAALALEAPATPAGWRADPEEQFLLEIAIRQLRVGDGARAYATPEGTCIIWQDLIGALDLPVRMDREARRAEGWALSEQNSLVIDRSTGLSTIRGETRRLPPHAIRDAPEGWCVDSNELSRWLGIGVKPNTAGSILFLQSEAKLPFELARERRDRAAALRTRASFDLRALPTVPLPYQLWRTPSVDALLSAGYLKDRRSGTRFDRSAAFLGAGELGGLSYESRAGTDSRGRLNLLRLRAFRADPEGGILGPLGATAVEAGDVDSYNSPLASESVSGRGVTVTNRPLHLLAAFDRTSFSGELPAGWDAELYRNGQLLAFSAAGADGRYRFDDVQLLYGENQFEVVSYGPQGQVRRRRERLSVGLEFVPPGQTWYWAGLVDPGRDLLGLAGEDGRASDERGIRGAVALEHGFGKRTSAGLLVQSLTLGGRRVSWTEATLRQSVGPALLEVGAARNGTRGRAFRAQLLARAGSLNLSAQSVLARDFRLFGTGVLAREEHRVGIDLPVRLGRGTLPMQADLRYRVLDGGARQMEANVRTSVQFSRFNLAMTGKLLRSDDGMGRRAPDQLTLGAIGSGSIARVRVRTAIDWRTGWQPGLQRAEVSAYWNGGERADWEGAIGWDGEYRRARARIGYVRRFRGLASNVSLEGASDGSIAAGLGLSFSLGSSGGRPLLSREPLAAGGNMEATVFRDLDGDGRRGADEPAEPDAIITAGLQLSERATDARGSAMLHGLPAYQAVAVGVDTSSLKDPTLVPARAAQLVTPRPGVIARVEIPLVGGGSIEGAVLKDGGGGFEGLDLELVDSQGKVIATTRSDYDGFFLFDRVAYGRYRVRLTEDSAAAAGTSRELHAQVSVSGDTPSVRLGARALVHDAALKSP